MKTIGPAATNVVMNVDGGVVKGTGGKEQIPSTAFCINDFPVALVDFLVGLNPRPSKHHLHFIHSTRLGAPKSSA